MKRIRLYSIVSLLLISAFAGVAQPGGGRPPGGSGGGPCANPPCNPVPITGIEVLITMGVMLGAKSLLKSRKKSD
jgi:hypothetical protein